MSIIPEPPNLSNPALLGLFEPDNNSWEGAAPVTLDASTWVRDALNRDQGDQYDYFKFDGQAGKVYTVFMENTDPELAQGGWGLTVQDEQGNTLGETYKENDVPAPCIFQTQVDGPVYFFVKAEEPGYPYYHPGTLAYGVRVKEGGSGDLDLTLE